MTAPFRIVQVSDTHLSRKRAYFHDNWLVFHDEMTARMPDLIIASGDLSFDGADDDDDLAFARAEYDRLPVPWISIPGNHDTGEAAIAQRLNQPIDSTRIARWNRCIGPQWWCRDIEAWRLVGIDTALLASELPEEAAQWRFLETSLAERGSRPVLLFQHMPPYVSDPNDMTPTKHAIPPSVRARLLDMCVRGGVKTIACGHVHVHQRMTYEGIDIVWAPATSFFNIVEQQKAGRGVPRPGYIEWTLNGPTLSHKVVVPPLMITHDVGSWNSAHGSTTKMPPRPLRD